MIIDKETKAYQTINLYPDSNWTDIPDDELYIVPDGSPLAEKIIENYPYFEFVEQEGRLIDITPTERPPEPNPLESAIKNKNAEIAAACSAMIDVGTEVQLPDGSKKAYTYTVEDQANVSEMFLACMSGATGYVYHANGEECRTYTAAEIVAIYGTLSMYKTGQITYQNQLKKLVGDQTTVDAVNKITYGQPLEGNYLGKYNQLMAEAKTQMEAVLSKIAGAVSE